MFMRSKVFKMLLPVSNPTSICAEARPARSSGWHGGTRQQRVTPPVHRPTTPSVSDSSRALTYDTKADGGPTWRVPPWPPPPPPWGQGRHRGVTGLCIGTATAARGARVRH